jgi:hypothetical protein
MPRPVPLAWLPVALAVGLCAGCGDSSTVSGTVTYAGKAVENGTLSFYPADRKGVARAATVAGGRYWIKDLAPGKKRVRLTARPDATLEPGPGGEKRLRLLPDREGIPAQGVENEEVVEVNKGRQTLDFALKPPR